MRRGRASAAAALLLIAGLSGVANVGSAGFAQTTTTTGEKPKIEAKYDVDRIGDRGIGSGLNLYSLEREMALGRELARETEEYSRLVGDPVITAYVNRIGQKLAMHSDARMPFTIRVIDDEQVNAFALPGGFLYVNTGLILAAGSEAQLAGVMAHEIAHVAARHGTKAGTRAQIWSLASVPLVFFGGGAMYAIRSAADIIVPMSFLKFSRSAEREADLLGLEYAYASGYDPAEFVQFFEKLNAQDKKKKHSFIARAFATHPMTGDRIKAAQGEIAVYLRPKEDYVVDTSDFAEVQERLLEQSNSRKIQAKRGTNLTLRRK